MSELTQRARAHNKAGMTAVFPGVRIYECEISGLPPVEQEIHKQDKTVAHACAKVHYTVISQAIPKIINAACTCTTAHVQNLLRSILEELLPNMLLYRVLLCVHVTLVMHKYLNEHHYLQVGVVYERRPDVKNCFKQQTLAYLSRSRSMLPRKIILTLKGRYSNSSVLLGDAWRTYTVKHD